LFSFSIVRDDTSAQLPRKKRGTSVSNAGGESLEELERLANLRPKHARRCKDHKPPAVEQPTTKKRKRRESAGKAPNGNGAAEVAAEAPVSTSMNITSATADANQAPEPPLVVAATGEALPSPKRRKIDEENRIDVPALGDAQGQETEAVAMEVVEPAIPAQVLAGTETEPEAETKPDGAMDVEPSVLEIAEATSAATAALTPPVVAPVDIPTPVFAAIPANIIDSIIGNLGALAPQPPTLPESLPAQQPPPTQLTTAATVVVAAAAMPPPSSAEVEELKRTYEEFAAIVEDKEKQVGELLRQEKQLKEKLKALEKACADHEGLKRACDGYNQKIFELNARRDQYVHLHTSHLPARSSRLT
jgi:hypothetical protein